MSVSQAVVVPFGVPDYGAGLGLGLAAIIHVCARISGQPIALAQLHARSQTSDGGLGTSHGGPVEVFMPPPAWRDLMGAEEASRTTSASIVLTGTLDPPRDGPGLFRVLAFDPNGGAQRGDVEVHLDETQAGDVMASAFDDLSRQIPLDPGPLRQIRDLGWDALRSLLLAERCLIHNAARGTAHDAMAALIYLERAVNDAGTSMFPGGRLSSVVLETAVSQASTIGAIRAAQRAFERAWVDLTPSFETFEVRRRIQLRLGALDAAKQTEQAAIELLSQPPIYPFAFLRLASLAGERSDSKLAQRLVDRALILQPDQPEMLRSAIRLALASEVEGIARAARIASLARALLRLRSDDEDATRALAHALTQMGEIAEATRQLETLKDSKSGT